MAGSAAEVEEISKAGAPKWLLAVAGLALVVGAGIGGFFMGSSGSPPEASASADAAGLPDGNGGPGGVVAGRATVTSLGSFAVNLRDAAGARVLQMDISVESSSEVAPVVSEREAQIRDSILMLASDYSTVELEGMDGKLRLRDEIHRRVNAVLAPERVTRVYFTSFVVH